MLTNGKIADCAPAAQILDNPRHEYTRTLFRDVPKF